MAVAKEDQLVLEGEIVIFPATTMSGAIVLMLMVPLDSGEEAIVSKVMDGAEATVHLVLEEGVIIILIITILETAISPAVILQEKPLTVIPVISAEINLFYFSLFFSCFLF